MDRQRGTYLETASLFEFLLYPFTMPTSAFHSSSTLLVSCAAALLCACGQGDGGGAARQSEAGLAPMPRSASEVAPGTRETDGPLRHGASVATGAVANAASDMTITTEVKTRLARDTQLGALAINVATEHGRVVLRGAATDTALRFRAAELARSANGVQSVDNQLSVQLPSN